MRPAQPLVGRSEELEVVDAVLAGSGGALAVVGPAGIGKSHLLAELTERAERGSRLVLSGSASELERDLPFGVFVDAMDDYVESLDPARLRRLEPEVRTELSRVLPALTGFGGEDG